MVHIYIIYYRGKRLFRSNSISSSLLVLLFLLCRGNFQSVSDTCIEVLTSFFLYSILKSETFNQRYKYLNYPTIIHVDWNSLLLVDHNHHLTNLVKNYCIHVTSNFKYSTYMIFVLKKKNTQTPLTIPHILKVLISTTNFF